MVSLSLKSSLTSNFSGIHSSSSPTSSISSSLLESLTAVPVGTSKLINVKFDSEVGVDINSITSSSLTVANASVALVDKLVVQQNSVVASFNVLSSTPGNHEISIVGSEVLDVAAGQAQNQSLGNLTVSNSPVVSLPSNTAAPRLLSSTLNTDIPVTLEFSHSSGIDISTITSGTIQVIDTFTGSEVGSTNFLGTSGSGSTITANFTFNIPTDGSYKLLVPENSLSSLSGDPVIEQEISSLYSFLEPPVWPRESKLTFSDSVSRKVFFQYGGRRIGGTGIIDSAIQPTSLEIRGNCERFRSKDVENSFAYQEFGFRSLSIGQDPSPFEGSSHFTGQCLFRIRLMVSKLPTSGNLTLFRLNQTSASGDYSSIRVTPSGEILHFRDEVQVSVTGNFITEGEWFNLAFDTNPSDRHHFALFRLDTNPTWTSLASFASYYNSSGGQINKVRYGIVGVGNSNNEKDLEVWLDSFVSSASSDQSVMDKLQYLAGSGCRDRTTNEARIALVYPDGLFREGVFARVRYSTDSNLSSGVINTTSKNLSTAEFHNTRWDLTSLSPGTYYYYQFQILDKNFSTIYTSETYRFRTLATDNSSFSMLVSGCLTPGAYARSYGPLKAVSEYAASATDWDGFFCTGDFTYADTGNADDAWQFPAETEEDFEQALRQVCTDRFLHDVFLQGSVFSMADDHVVTNNIDSQYAPGGPLEGRLPSEVPGLVPTYSGNTTVGQLWTRGYNVFNAWFSGQQINPASEAALYGATNFGNTRILKVDARYERREDLNQYVSPTQFQWLKDEISSFGASSQTVLHIFCNNSWAIEGSKTSEGWERIALAQWQELMEHIYSAVPSSKRVLVNSGDNHKGYAFHTYSYRNGSVGQATNPFVGEIISAGITNTFHDNPISPTYRVFEYSQSGVSDRELIKISGTLYEQAANASSLRVKAWNNVTLELDEQIFTL